jgi:putative oxidoreductase
MNAADRPRRLRLHPLIVRLAQWATGIVFAWAGLAKLGNLPAFALQIHHFRLLPVAAENLVAMVLPWIELVTALALLLHVRARAGAVVAASLLFVMTLAVGSAVARGLDFECGCFGTSDGSRVGTAKLLENLALLAVAWIATRRATVIVGASGEEFLASRAGGRLQ